MSDLDPLDVWCPTCAARPGEACRTGTDRLAYKPHLQRLTALRRQREATPRGSTLERAAPPAKRAKPSQRKRQVRRGEPGTSRIRPNTRARVRARSHDICEAAIDEVCTRAAEHMHHVLPASGGGRGTVANLLHVCLDCHEALHSHRTWAYQVGLLRKRGATHELAAIEEVAALREARPPFTG